MYLSRVEVAWSHARNPYNLHRALWSLFPGEPRESRQSHEDERAGFLFRVEESKPGRAARLLVQSRKAPQAVADSANVIGTRDFHPKPVTGQQLAFVITANPVKTIADAQGRKNARGEPKKCRVPLISEDEQHAWLERKLSGAADLVAVEIRKIPPLFFHKSGTGKFVTAAYEGVLRVSDPAAMCGCLENGVGPAKGFGCGLLLVRRI